MSFWNKAASLAKNVGTTIFNEIESNANQVREIHEKHNDKTDSELFEFLARSQSKREKGVVSTILRKRGYSTDDINART